MKYVRFEALTFESASPVVDRFYGYHINLLAKSRKGVNSPQIDGYDPPKFSITDRYNGTEDKS